LSSELKISDDKIAKKTKGLSRKYGLMQIERKPKLAILCRSGAYSPFRTFSDIFILGEQYNYFGITVALPFPFIQLEFHTQICVTLHDE
jgi:hypothetical protein